MKRMVYLKTGTMHYVKELGGRLYTFCAIDVDEENWKPPEETTVDRTCKRCRVAAGVPARLVYNYGPNAWQRR